MIFKFFEWHFKFLSFNFDSIDYMLMLLLSVEVMELKLCLELYVYNSKIYFFYILAQNMKLHHAGWDAFYTGYCFVKMIHIITNFSHKT